MDDDEFFLKRAFKLANRGRFTAAPNPNVGCVIVQKGRIVGEGNHQYFGEQHAEICALHNAGSKAYGATAYVTLEPCSHHGKTPPCTEALIQAGIARVVSTISDPNPQIAGRGFFRLQQAGIKVRYGLMISDAETINRGFLKRMRTGFPWVRLKLASSLDGRTAMASGESQWITSLQSRQDVQCWRAESDAILSTATTVLADNPTLTVRWSSLPKDVQAIYPLERFRQPIRVIIDSNNCVRPLHRIIMSEGLTWLARKFPDDLVWPSSVEQIQIPMNEGNKSKHLDLIELMIRLGCRQINNLWVEAGARLAGALLSSNLVDELILYQAPKLLGSDARPLCFLKGLEKLSTVPSFVLLDVQQVGPDVRLRLTPDR
ncbi:bifunctional diaminohydroxyphosphoribosylaminopyrimidine deaminase/5-amino-6-(5-phosphoribosylamino)uracil reductase RibD [Sodalis sp. CWE]|uniref:bifunctional diaminohydroxyphosphoribosylaminopyrimidine deaminase/5-amino-6-(5-phosphoribosylamino)uracil reductase RibD n=1 Tax=Sodalis sp. CWE TaxID=2803816 RepID=UPI001C7DDA82|nr:bifunctional diaminohydroxyphosphoribosylaminopyrimidine deaminase/5-amino-6-(5-phosphoribosylamino)uracil reductase RibD [Sodalis sp. CWE]MBX4181209.1 bifunctional diaminohydroxyphosphoribosylaminopyrimidine deaminase/5-amino-6-(5-phosphoribosylamino)uracil reductase RibD [Sodalis sp. CWE]